MKYGKPNMEIIQRDENDIITASTYTEGETLLEDGMDITAPDF